MKTTRTKIDVYNGTLTMELDDIVGSFKMLEDKYDPSDSSSCYVINMLIH